MPINRAITIKSGPGRIDLTEQPLLKSENLSKERLFSVTQKHFDSVFLLFRYSLSNICFYSRRKNIRIGSIKTTSSAYRRASISLRTRRQTTFFHRRVCIFYSDASREYGRRTTKLKSGIHRFRCTFRAKERKERKRVRERARRAFVESSSPRAPFQARSLPRRNTTFLFHVPVDSSLYFSDVQQIQLIVKSSNRVH